MLDIIFNFYRRFKKSISSSKLFILIITIVIFSIFLIKKMYFKSEVITKGQICLIIDDFGFSFNSKIRDFFELHNNITYAIIPGTPFSKVISKYADSLGYETIIHMPMESYEQDSSKYLFELHERLNAGLVEEKINAAFKEIPNALGINNHQGSKATASLQLMKDIARSLKKINKFYLDSFTNPESRGYITMRRYGVPTQLRQVFLDHIETPEQIKSNLDSLVSLSHIMPIAIGIGHVKPTTFDVLKREIPRLEKEGYKFIRLSSSVR
tara:strand:+ start:559 stop:1362 length:804 start_codon:yes stop_codon:yes gene_type:complete